MSQKEPAKYWAQKCADSRGSIVMLPAKFNDAANEIQKKADELDELSLNFTNLTKNFWTEVRKELKAAGVRTALTCQLGFNEEAADDGMKVINIIKGQGGEPMRM